MSSSVKNRTIEFQSIVESLHQKQNSVQPRKNEKQLRSEFSRMAGAIGRDINSTASKLEKLTKLVKKKSIFDDRPVEIQELTFIIKQDINSLNEKIGGLKQYISSRQTQTKNKQANDFSNQVVVSLQSKLATTSTHFKDILEVRTQNMKHQKDRREQFSVNPAPGPKQSASSSALYRRPSEKEKEKEDFIAIDMGASMQAMEQETYSESRYEEIRSIESTIDQLGNIFQQLAKLVMEQGEQIQRIDQNVEDAEHNINEAEKQIVSIWHGMSGNRWLMVKIFLVLIVFFVVFVIFFA